MRKIYLLMAIAVFLTGCGGVGAVTTSSSNGKLTGISKDRSGAEKIKELEIRKGIMTVTESTHSAKGNVAKVVHYDFVLNNFEFDEKDNKSKDPKEDGQISGSFTLYGAKDATKETPIKEGTYSVAQHTDGVDVNDKVGKAEVEFFENGKNESFSVSTVSPRKGQVVIKSVSGDTVSGEIDMTDDFRTIKGNFTAKIVKK